MGLCAIKAAGCGVNLTAGSLVIITDPWWAPAVEEQAEDRCHRLGQQNAVEIVRLVARGSIEEKILSIAAKKHELMKGLHVSKDGAALVQTKMCRLFV